MKIVLTSSRDPVAKVALITSSVLVFLPSSGDEKDIYILLFELKSGSRIIPDKPPWPAKSTSGTPFIDSGFKTPSSINLSCPDNSVNKILLLSMTAIPQGWLRLSAIIWYLYSCSAEKIVNEKRISVNKENIFLIMKPSVYLKFFQNNNHSLNHRKLR